MPVITGGWYTKELIRAHPEWLFLFGDNNERIGLKGQAYVCRGEPNCLGIRTKWLPNMRPNAFFADVDYAHCTKMITEDLQRAFEYVDEGGVVVLPMTGLGTGFAELEDHAPGIYRYLENAIQIMVERGAGQEMPEPVTINSRGADLIQRAAKQSHLLMIWTVYRGDPKFPELFVARPTSSKAVAPMLECVIDHTLERLRLRLPAGLSCLPRLPEDMDHIVETWVS